MITKDSKDFITSIARCMDVIKTFDAENMEQTPADIAAKTGLTRATARRILLTLNALGYVASDGKWFRLSPRILDLSFSYFTSMQVDNVLQPIINTASKKVGETCVISVIDGPDVISVVHSLFDRYAQVTFNPGTHIPIYASAAGKVMLAFLSDEEIEKYLGEVKFRKFTRHTISSKSALKKELVNIKEAGYASVNGELEEGLYTVAAPVFNDSNIPIAAVSFGGNIARINEDNVKKKYLPELEKVAMEIAQLMPHKHSIF